jgi:hypothetical protein
MKVYQVTMPYFDGDHDHGVYESPLFLNREDAENFLSQVDGEWLTEDFEMGTKPSIVEHEILEAPIKVDKPFKYLIVTFT